MHITRIISTSLALAGLLVAASTANAQALSVAASGSKKITLSDKVGRNQFEWHSSAPLEEIRGTADGITGSITIDPKKPASISGSINVPVASMKSGNATRDEHLHGAQWLDAASHPAITFTITSVKSVQINGNKMTAQAVGNFTMHGVTRQITVPFTLQYIDASAKTRQRAPGDFAMITAEFEVALKDFNVAGSKGVVGSKVGEKIKVKAQLFGSTGV